MLFTRNLKSKSKAGHEATRQWRKHWLFGMLWLSSLLLARQPATTAPQQPKAQSFRISGTIVDAITGAILSHARISVAPVTKRDDLRSVITGEDGQFSFDGLQRGKYSLIAQHRGYLTQAFNQHDQYASAVAVGPDIESEHLVFRMRPDASITGKVLDESNEPVRDARVMAFSTFIQAGTLGTHLRSFAVTDDQGHYRFSHLPPGRYYVAVSARPWYGRPQWEQQEENAADAADNQDSADSEDGKNEDQTPKGAVALKTQRPATPPPNKEVDVAYPTTFYPNVTDSGSASQLVLAPGQKFVADFTLYAVPALHVLLPRRDYKPERGNFNLKQLLFNTYLLPVGAQTTQLAGHRALIVGIAPGTYILEQTASENGKASTLVSREVELASDGEIDTARDRLLVPVIGTVKAEAPGAASVSGSAQLRDRRSGRIFSVPIGAGGSFEFTNGILPGSYDIAVAAPTGNVIKSLSAENAKVNGATLQIPGTGVVNLTIVMTQGVGRVDGVALKDGKPFAGAMMVLVPEDPGHNFGLFRRDQSDSDGSFTLNSALPGNYTVVAIENGWDLEWFNPEALKPYLAGGTAIQLHSKENLNVKVSVQIAGGAD